MWPVALCLVSLVIVLITNWVYKWRNPVCNGKLPPGSMGFPLLGETIQFFKPQSSFDIHPFIKQRMKRYGSLFKTNLVGCPIIITTDPEFSHFIFQQEGNSVELWYLDSFMKLIGERTLHENGYQITDSASYRPTTRNDTTRIEYLQSILRNLLPSLRNGSDVRGYFV